MEFRPRDLVSADDPGSPEVAASHWHNFTHSTLMIAHCRLNTQTKGFPWETLQCHWTLACTHGAKGPLDCQAMKVSERAQENTSQPHLYLYLYDDRGFLGVTAVGLKDWSHQRRPASSRVQKCALLHHQFNSLSPQLKFWIKNVSMQKCIATIVQGTIANAIFLQK